ncbi:hypothetical protein S83_017194 [Arachis hypogaea]
MSDLITIVYHHGSIFVIKNDDSVVYEKDNTDELSRLDEDRLNVFSLRDYYKELGYANIVECWWLILVRPLKNGLRALSHDKELLEMCYLARMNQGRVHLKEKARKLWRKDVDEEPSSSKKSKTATKLKRIYI